MQIFEIFPALMRLSQTTSSIGGLFCGLFDQFKENSLSSPPSHKLGETLFDLVLHPIYLYLFFFFG